MATLSAKSTPPLSQCSTASSQNDAERIGGSDVEENEAMDSETTPLFLEVGGGGLAKHVEPVVFPFGLSPFLADLQQHFGYRLLIMLFASQHLLKGFAGAFTGPASQFLFASYNVRGPQMQIYSGVIMLPFAMKPIIGLLSDCFPIGGYNKAPYVVGTTVLSVIACMVLSQVSQAHLSVTAVVVCLFVLQFQFSTCDLLTEAKYAEKMQAAPSHGPNLMTYVWFGLQVGGLFAMFSSGPFLEAFGPKKVYAVGMLPVAFILWPTLKNYMEEKPQTDEQAVEARSKIMEQKEAVFLCIIMFVGTIAITVVAMVYESPLLNCIVAMVVAVVMLVAFSVVLRPIIAKVNAFFLLQTALGFSIGGASFYFYTDSEEKYHNGPHFSMTFYTSVLGVVGSVCSLFGIYSYQRWMKEWKYRHMLLFTNLVLSALSVLDVIFLSRLNVKWGIPDHVFVLGASVFQTVVAQWMWMPGVVILSQLCPKGMEAIMYALLAGCHNLGNTIASNCGALVLQLLGCEPSGADNEDDQFERLWIGAVLSTILPMFTLLLLPWLIPDARQTDKLLAEDDRDATTGSLWQKWTQRS